MSGILLAFFVTSGGGAAAVVADGSFSGAPIADLSFGG
jgi:hypothetical protein